MNESEVARVRWWFRMWAYRFRGWIWITAWRLAQWLGAPGTKYLVAAKSLRKQLIQIAMRETRGSYTEAARILGVHPNYLHRLIRNLDLKESLWASPNGDDAKILGRKT